MRVKRSRRHPVANINRDSTLAEVEDLTSPLCFADANRARNRGLVSSYAARPEVLALPLKEL